MKKILSIIVIGMLIAIPLRSFAAEQKFFEYTTDVGSPIEVPSGSIVIQEFKIFNDYIGGIDMWYDNTGSTGSATVSLLDFANNILDSKSVSIPVATPFYTGQRLHVLFNKTIGVNSGEWYKLKITSATPKLRLYGVKRVQFVEHNAPYPTDYSIGSSLLDGEPQFSVFKFALYEITDTEPPSIANASSTIASPDSMTVSFNANELVDRSLVYGPVGSDVVSTIGYTGNYSICFEGVYACPITFNAQRNTIYVYRLSVKDSWGNVSYVDGTFESWKPGTPTPPIETPVTPPAETPPVTPPAPPVAPFSIIGEKIASVSNAAVMVSWDTSRSANSSLTVSTAPVGGQIIKTIADSVQEITHTIATDNILAANTTYYATIVSHAQDGSVAAKVIPFTTLKKSATTTIPLGVDASLQQLSIVVPDDQLALSISWNSPSANKEPTNGYRVDIIDAQGNLFQTKNVSAGLHTITVSDLAVGEYRAVVYANNGGVVEKVAAPAVITVRKSTPTIDTYELIKKPIVYVPAGLFVLLVAGLYWYSKRPVKVTLSQ
jgi:hypothetical protein